VAVKADITSTGTPDLGADGSVVDQVGDPNEVPATTPLSKALAAASPTPVPQTAPGPLAASALLADCVGGPWPAAGSPAGGFEIDGDVCTNNPSNADWDSVAAQIRVDGEKDSTRFTSGAAERDWPWSVPQISGTAPGGGGAVSVTDIIEVYTYSHLVGDDVWTYIGVVRAAGSGSVAYRVELNQRQNSSGPIPTRTAGDLRLTFADVSTGVLVLAGADRWDGGWQPLGAGAAVIAANAGPATDLSGTLRPAQTFVEAAVNVSALTKATGCSGGFTTLNARSSSAATETSNLVDWIEPIDVGVPNTCPQVRVVKKWVVDGVAFDDGDQPAGFSAAPQLTGQTAPRFGTVYSKHSDGTSYLVGDTVTIDETVSTPPGCTTSSTGRGSQRLTGGLNTFTITNTVTCTYLTLKKEVVGGSATAGQWTLYATGPTTFSGAGNSASVTRVHVAPGTYAVAESASPPGYNLALGCTAPLAGTNVTVAAGADVTCTFTNTASRQVVLKKVWDNPVPGDAVALTVTDGTSTDTATVTAPTGGQVSLDVGAGATVTVGETFVSGSQAQYGTTLACDNGVDPAADGSFTVPASLAAGTTITCTATNIRNATTLTLVKEWVDGAVGDSATLSVDGTHFATSTASGQAGSQLDVINVVRVTVRAGDQVDLAETMGTNTGTYAPMLVCDKPGLVYTSGASSGVYQVADDPDPVTCTFTNSRTRATMTVTKTWTDSYADDTVELWVKGQAAASFDSAVVTAPGGSASFSDVLVVPIFSGDQVTITEMFAGPNQWSYTSTLTCSALSKRMGRASTYDIGPAPYDVDCEFVNERVPVPTLVLYKEWVGGAVDDAVDLGLQATTGDESVTAVVPGAGTGFSGEQISIDLAADDVVTISETFGLGNTGSYGTRLVCNQPGLDYTDGDLSGVYQVPTPAVPVTCVFTNTRLAATLTLSKQWVNGAGGDEALLSIDAAGPGLDPSIATPGFATAVVPAGGTGPSVASAQLPALSGATMVVAEAFGVDNVGAYTGALTCSDPSVLDTVLQTVTVPASPANIECTFTNTRTSATLRLGKTWVDAAGGDTVVLDIDGTSVTSTATGAPGAETDTNEVSVTVWSGTQVSVSESSGANTGTYTAELACDAAGLDYTGGDLSGTFTVPPAATDVVCMFTNTRTSATLTVLKRWVDGADGDSADLAIASVASPGPAPPAWVAATATVPAGGQGVSQEQVSATIYSGVDVHVREGLDAGNTGTYTTELACDAGTPTYASGDLSGTFTVPTDPVNMVCTFTNTRVASTLTLRKTWVDGATHDTAFLSLDRATTGRRTATSVATGAAGPYEDTTNEATATVLSGGDTVLAEVLGGVGSYDVDLVCSAPGLAYTGGDTTGTYTAPAVATDVVCAFTNTRTSATLTLRKTWVDGVAGDTTDLEIAAAGPQVTATATSTATGAPGAETDTTNQTQAVVFSGQMVLLSDAMPSGNGSVYSAGLVCTVTDGLVYEQHAVEGMYAVGADPRDVTCAFTNTATDATLTLHKTWVDAEAGDVASMIVTGTDPGTSGGAISTATGASGAHTDLDNVVTVPIYPGTTVEIVEEATSGNVASYLTGLTCDADMTPAAGGHGGTLVVAANPGHIECTFTNTRTQAALVFQVQWVDGVGDDAVTISSSGVTATAHVPPGGSGVAVDMVQTTLSGGQTVTLAWFLDAANLGSYAATLECDQPGLSVSAAGGTFAVPEPPVPTTCTLVLVGPTPGLDVTKSVLFRDVEGDTWTVVFAIDVTNVISVPVQYSLTDTLAFGAGMTVTSTDVEAPSGVTTNPTWDGTTSTVLVPSAVVDADATDEYLVTVTVTVPASANLHCSAGGGFANTASAVRTAAPGVDAPTWSGATCADAVEDLEPGPDLPPGPGNGNGNGPGSGNGAGNGGQGDQALSATGARTTVVTAAFALLLLAGTLMVTARRRSTR